MDGKIYLLDTNIIIAFFSNEQYVVEKFSTAKDIIIPSIVLGELFYGAEKSGKKEQNMLKLEAFTQSSSILPCDETTARLYGKVKTQLKNNGTPIPENDIWISALALQHGLMLVSRDKHFTKIDALSLESW
jgi:tRNA(fMet)-specific endonuclease VapC